MSAIVSTEVQENTTIIHVHQVTVELENEEIIDFYLTESISDDGIQWDWWAEPETVDIEDLGMGLDEALDYLSDLVIAKR